MDKDNMDNDLSDIMKEIEALEQDFRNEEKEFAKSPIIEELAQLNEELSAPVGQKSEPAVEDKPFDWLQGENNKAEPLQTSEAEIFEMKANAQVKEEPSHVTPISKAPKAPKTEWKSSKMQFKFPEDIPLSIEFYRGQECVSFSWSEEGFHVEVEGGISFTLPVSEWHKKAS